MLHDLHHRADRVHRPERHRKGDHPADESPAQQDVDHCDRTDVGNMPGTADQDGKEAKGHRRADDRGEHGGSDKG